MNTGVPLPRGEGRALRTAPAFAAFFDYWSPRVLRYLRTLTRDDQLAEDVLQEVMIAAHRSWERLVCYDRPDTWLFKVATRQLRRQQGAQRRAGTSLDEVIRICGEDLVSEPARQEAVAAEITVREAVGGLPRRQAEVVALHHMFGFTIAEVGDIVGISTGTVKTHLFRGMTRLRDQLFPPGSDAEDGRP